MSRRARQRRSRQGGAARVFLRLVGVFLALSLLLTAVGAATTAAAVTTWLHGLPDYRSPSAFELAEPTKIYSADGKLIAKFYLQNREIVPLSQIATSLADGIVAVEDERYFEHGGVDPLGIVRAAFTTVTGDRQGASTITQQYIRNTVLFDERREMTLARKVREAYLAIEIEKTLSKSEILEDYLNTVYFGEGAYGAEAAAHAFFAKSASQLTLPEGALIAGLVQSPSKLDPFVNPAAAIVRRREVLDRMLVNRYITQADHDAAVSAPLELRPESQPLDGIYAAPYFVSHVRTLLQQQFTTGVVFNGGLTVYTTLDTRLQTAAEKAAHRDFKARKDPSDALVAIDPRTGYVKAMVGGRNYAKNKFNLATQGHRQPGSAFKTFVLVTALSKGMSPSYKVDSHAPVSIPAKRRPWVVNNNEGTGKGMMPLDAATWGSVNAVYARVAYYAVGVKNVARTAKSMGISTPIPNFPSIALGTVGCTPMEMASAYGTLATGGVQRKPITITKVLDREGNVVFEAQPKGKRVIKREVAYAATKVLEGVITQGTGKAADIGRPAAGKTGTTQSNRDCWFIGYTPQLVTAVWVGFTPERTVMINGSKGFGGTVAAPIWARFMRAALAGQPVRDFAWAATPSFDGSFNIPVSKETKYAEAHPVRGKATKVAPPSPTPPRLGKSPTSRTARGSTKRKGKSKGSGGGSTSASSTP